MTEGTLGPGPGGLSRRGVVVGVAGVLALAMLAVAGLLWAKWLPYAHKASGLAASHDWTGGVIFTASGRPGQAPSLSGAWQFTTTYFASVWQAATVALLVAAALDALVPRAWLLRVMNRRTRLGQALAGGTLALPSLMCTCCTAPVTVSLRNRGAGTAASLAYWVGNPVLNPAVLVFLFLVTPWQFGVVRIVVGVLLVFGATTLVARLAPTDAPDRIPPRPLIPTADTEPQRLRDMPRCYARSLTRFAVVLIPEYFLVVMAVGALSSWWTAFAGLDAHLGLLAVILIGIIGTLLVIPTGGEIPVILGLTTIGVGAASAGALLITLPALSLPSMVMVGKALSWRVTTAMAIAVTTAGLLGALLVWVLM